MSHQLAPFTRTPIPTFEAFLGARVVEQQLYPGTQLVEAAFDTLMSDLTQAKVDALSKHNSTQDTTQCMFDQACVLLSQHLERELNEDEQQYAKERCEALCELSR